MSVKVITLGDGVKVIGSSDSKKVLVGGVGAPGPPGPAGPAGPQGPAGIGGGGGGSGTGVYRTGICLNFEGGWEDGQELGGFYAPGDDVYDPASCAAYTDAPPAADAVITIKKNGTVFGTLTYPAGGVSVFTFTDGVVAFRDMIQFFAPSPPDTAFAANSILYILLTGS